MCLHISLFKEKTKEKRIFVATAQNLCYDLIDIGGNMRTKKYTLYLLIMITLLITTGCGKKVEVKNGAKVAVSIKEDKFTATEYYEKIKENNISILVDMIDHSLFDKKYKTDSEETEYVNNQINQIKSYYGQDETTYDSILQQYFGVENEEQLKEKLSLEYKRNKAVEDYVKENIKDNEIKDYYNENITGEVSASHILITVDAKEDASEEEKEKAENEAKKTAEKIIKELNEGKKFATLAKKYSKDNATASNGGSLGYFDVNSMTEKFADAVKKLKKDEYTKEPVKTEYGYHIILKTGEKDKPKISKVKNDIKEKLTTKKLEEDKSLHYKALKAIRENNKIKWNDDTLRKAYEDYTSKLIDNAKSNN